MKKQVEFFDVIAGRYGKERMLTEMQEVLHIQRGAAYKRINGTTNLTVEELCLLSTHFNVSLDTALQQKGFMTFRHPFIEDSTSFNFLDRYNFFLKHLTSATDSSLTYMANELPVFYYFSHRYIFNFLLSVWSHLHWDNAKISIKVNQSLDPQMDLLRSQVSAYYESHPVTEIWNANMLNNLYQQIIFAITTRSFDDPDYINLLISDIDQLIARLHRICTSTEAAHGRADIYLNEFGNYLNLAVYKDKGTQTAFVGFDIPHFVVSYHKDFVDFCGKWAQKIKSRSVRISSDGYQSRELFFLKINSDFKDFKERVEKIKAVYY